MYKKDKGKSLKPIGKKRYGVSKIKKCIKVVKGTSPEKFYKRGVFFASLGTFILIAIKTVIRAMEENA